MDLNQNVRWQHVAIFAALVGLLSGAMMLAISISGRGTELAAPWWIAAVIIACSLVVGGASFVSLRKALCRAAFCARLAQGAFELHSSSHDALIRLNARIASQFGLRTKDAMRSPMPETFGGLVTATTDRVRAEAAILPNQLDGARSALAAVLGITPSAVSWAVSPTKVIPTGRGRFQRWERLRAKAPGLPEATMNPWIENIAIYGFLAALIAIAVPIAKQFDSDEATRIQRTVPGLLVGKAFGLLVFGSILAVFMAPMYFYGKRYATRLPAEIADMGALARHFPPGEGGSEWTQALVADHLSDLVSAELGIAEGELREGTPLQHVVGRGSRRDSGEQEGSGAVSIE